LGAGRPLAPALRPAAKANQEAVVSGLHAALMRSPVGASCGMSVLRHAVPH
jgi:hypothetical protein